MRLRIPLARCVFLLLLLLGLAASAKLISLPFFACHDLEVGRCAQKTKCAAWKERDGNKSLESTSPSLSRFYFSVSTVNPREFLIENVASPSYTLPRKRISVCQAGVGCEMCRSRQIPVVERLAVWIKVDICFKEKEIAKVFRRLLLLTVLFLFSSKGRLGLVLRDLTRICASSPS